MKVYIAGKISEDDHYRSKFAAYERALANKGHSVMNPARIGSYSEFTHVDYMIVTLSMLSVCDAVLFLPDWESSVGARLEHDAAMELSKTVYYGLTSVPVRC